MVIESASAHLLPRFPTDELQQSAKVKFKSVLEAIYKGPLVQSVINSNPISSTINAAIQQAGFFEKSRQPVTLVTKKQIKDISETLPLKIEVNTANAEGTSFGTKEINEFNTDLEKRIEFYVAINQYGIDQGAITQQLYIEAKLIKKSAKASKTEICKLLEIDPNNASASFNTKFGSITIDQMKNYLTRDANFKKALSLSDYAQERLPEVKEFNTTVIDAVVEYIDGYIKLLNKYKDIQEAKLNATEISKQVSKLEGIKAGLKKPLK